jgi:outer membrane protein assembly factor BamB
MAASPVIAADLVLLLCDQVEGSFLLAVDKDTGEQRWRAERPGRIESYTTPLLYPAEEPTAVLAFGSGWIDAYGLTDGSHLWEMPGAGEGPVASPVVAGSMMVVTTPNHVEEPFPPFEELLASADTDGDERMSATEFAVVPGFGEHFGWTDRDSDGLLTADEYHALVKMAEESSYGVIGISLPDPGSSEAAEIVWTHEQSLPYIPTPLVYQGVLYLVRDGGIVQSLDPVTGEVFKRGRTSRSAGSVFSSPVAG